jgi:hypothetical protein
LPLGTSQRCSVARADKEWKIDDLNWHVNQIFGCAWKQIDWWTLYKRAEENVKQTAESVAE